MAVQFKPNLLGLLKFLNIGRIHLKRLNCSSLTAGIILASTVAVAVAPSLLHAMPLRSNSADKRVPYIPPPDAGTPETTGGTGSRGGCQEHRDRPPIASLVGQPHLMLTTSDRPVLWAYIPYLPTDAPTGTLSVQQGATELYRGSFTLTATPGVIGIPLPETAPALAVDQAYEWFVDIHCPAALVDSSLDSLLDSSVDSSVDSSQTASDPAIVGGWVKRVTLSEELAIALDNAQSAIDTVAAYGTHHIWYDLLTHLARLRLVSESNTESSTESVSNTELEAFWDNLLGDGGAKTLTQWATQPIVEEVIVYDAL